MPLLQSSYVTVGVAVSAVLHLCCWPVLAEDLTDAIESIDASEHRWHGTANAAYKGGDSRHIGHLGFTLPISQTADTLLFADFRGRVDDQDTEEFNLGFAYRHILPSDWIIGAYGFFDRNTTAYGNQFDQATLGFELMNEAWDFRVNGYIPDRTPQFAGASPNFRMVSVRGNRLFVDNQFFVESAYYGVDYEVGKRVAVFGENENEVRVFGGGYYFDNDSEGFPHIGGARIRLEARLFDLPLLGDGSRMTLSGDIQWDPVRETQGFGGLAIQIPLGKGTRLPSSQAYSPLKRRMYDPIVRDIDVVTQLVTKGNPEDPLVDENGRPILLAAPVSTTQEARQQLNEQGVTAFVPPSNSGSFAGSGSLILVAGTSTSNVGATTLVEGIHLSVASGLTLGVAEGGQLGTGNTVSLIIANDQGSAHYFPQDSLITIANGSVVTIDGAHTSTGNTVTLSNGTYDVEGGLLTVP